MAYHSNLTTEARDELDATLAYYAQFDPRLKTLFLIEFRKLRLRLTENPYQFPKLFSHYRRAVFPSVFPYSLIFVIEENSVSILAVAHDKRAPDYWQK